MIGVLLAGFGSLSLWQRYAATHRTADPAPQTVVSHSTDEPDETPVSANAYTVPAGQPRQIIIPSANIRGFIQKVGTDQHNAIAAPNNVNLAGWYIQSAKPGDPGVSIIDAHVQGRYTPGVFKNLSKVRIGDTITVEYGDHSQRTFQVVKTDTLPVEAVSGEQYVKLPGVDRQLTLITCAGSFDKASGNYTSRTLVRAKLL